MFAGLAAKLAIFAAGKTGKLIAVLVLVTTLVASYFWWEHSVRMTGYDTAVAEFADRDSKMTQKVLTIQAANKAEVEALKRQFAETYIEGVTSYAKDSKIIIDGLTSDLNRLRLSTKTKGTCADRVPTESRVPGGNIQGSEKVYRAELEPETSRTIIRNAYEVEQYKLAVEKALPFIEDNFTIK